MDIREEIGVAMAKARIKSGLSRSEIARRMGVSDVSIYYWEIGRNPITVDERNLPCMFLLTRNSIFMRFFALHKTSKNIVFQIFGAKMVPRKMLDACMVYSCMKAQKKDAHR